jgi:rSAM/selenodomain-associated transferase 2
VAPRRENLTPAIPAVSIVVPVLNESARINDLIAHLHTIEHEGNFEIIVVDGDPDGRTLKTIHDHSVVKIKSPKGRGTQMNEGAKIARAAILLFLHADTELPQEAYSLIATALSNGRFVAGAFDLGINSTRTAFRLIEMMASLRSRMTRVPFGDQAVFIRSEYFRAIGGYKDISLMEDVEIMQRIKKKGDDIYIIRRKVLTSPRRWEKEGVFRCTLRNWVLQLLYFFGVSPNRLAKVYRQH